MNSTILLSVGDRRWTELAQTSPDALTFHHPAWAQLVADCYGFRPFVMATEQPGGELAAALPVIEVRHVFARPKWVSLPFTDHCPVLAVSDRDRDELISSIPAVAQAAGIDRVEVRTPVGTPGGRPVPGALGHRITLDGDIGDIEGRARSSHRRNVRAAQRSGVAVREGSVAEDLTDTFYRLHVETRRRQGTPVQPRRYFRMLWERMLEPGLGTLLLADHEHTTVAGAVFLTSTPNVVYKYGASSTRGRSLRANDLLLWRAIEWSAQNGRQTFDFGRTAECNAGLARFKRGWGAEEAPLPYHVFGSRSAASPGAETSGLVHAVLQRAPSPIVRVAGELFYRFAA